MKYVISLILLFTQLAIASEDGGNCGSEIAALQSQITNLEGLLEESNKKYNDLLQIVSEANLIKVQCDCDLSDEPVIGKGNIELEARYNANAICKDPKNVGILDSGEIVISNCKLSSGTLSII